jgi:hypothetical protein
MAEMRGLFTAFLVATSLGQTQTVATPVWSVTQWLASIASRNLLVVPHLGLNRVSAYDLPDLR